MKPSSEVEQPVLHSGLTPSHLSVSMSSIYFLMSMYPPPPAPLFSLYCLGQDFP